MVGATVIATHTPSGTRYGTVTNTSGRYNLPAVRVGGPFALTVSYTGYETETRDAIFTALGVGSEVDFSLREAGTALGEVTIAASRSSIFSGDRTGASTTFGRDQLSSLPTVGSRSINAITKYNPNGNGTSFGGQDSRMNNFTIDGSVFNNGFGLGSDAQAGGRTNSTAISLDALEELQVNVAPFDVRQSGFVGSGINAVTRSGTNSISGSAYATYRNNSKTFNGDNAAGNPVSIGEFKEYVVGLRLGGPIIKDKLFFFVNGEIVRKTEPATPWVTTGSPNTGQVTRVKYQDMVDISSFLKNKYGYDTGAFENYDNETTSDKFLARLDFNINDDNKLTLRYTHHNSVADQLISNSNSAGAGNRRTLIDAMSFQNSGYLIGDNTRSIVAELNTSFSDKVANNFLVGYDYQNEDRQYKASLFPTVDILEGGKTYISTGFDPFTPSNKLDYGTFHITDNVTLYKGAHTVTLGANYEYYKSNNLFFPASNGVYVFNSLADFYSAANATTDTSPVKLNLFQYRYSALPGGIEPLQVLEVNKFDLYGQDEIRFSKRFKMTYGLRASVISFVETGLDNPTVNNQDYIGVDGKRGYKIVTSQLPDPNVLLEPRLGFNWDVTGKKKTQLRGGTGIFTGRPPYVWISNQIGNNGVLTGFIQSANSTKYKFTDDPTIFRPDQPTLPSTFDIAATDAGYRFPQVWKTDIAIDQKLPFGLVASVELMYNQNVNAVRYFDANLEPATARFSGPDNRPRFPGSGITGSALNNAVRINDNISRAAVMTTTNEGFYRSATFKLEYPSAKGLYGMIAYTRSEAKDLMSAGSIASGSWTGARSVFGNNILSLTYADQDMPDRIVGMLGYRIEYGKEFGGATQFALGYVGERRGFNPSPGIQTSRVSYAYAGDMNGDGITNNDLIFVPEKAGDLKFEKFNVGADTFTTTAQIAALDAFIDQDEYLSTRRGQYAERNGVLFPWLQRLDLSVMQEVYIKVGGKRNTLQIRADILNFANLLNPDWGVAQRIVTDRPLTYRSVGADGVPVFRMATQVIDGKTQLLKNSFVSSATTSDVWGAQLGIRYIFN